MESIGLPDRTLHLFLELVEVPEENSKKTRFVSGIKQARVHLKVEESGNSCKREATESVRPASEIHS